jgi:hypothetical protein
MGPVDNCHPAGTDLLLDQVSRDAAARTDAGLDAITGHLVGL